MHELDDMLQHFGIKGMKWGRHKQSTTTKQPGRIKQELNSLSRERQWRKVLNDVNSLTTKEINQKANRIQMENDLKRLSKDKQIGSKKDKTDYLNRANMSNQELSRKVTRLKAKENLNRVINDASRQQIELGKKVATVGGSLAVKYAFTGSIGRKDIANALINPKQAKNQATKTIIDKTINK